MLYCEAIHCPPIHIQFRFIPPLQSRVKSKLLVRKSHYIFVSCIISHCRCTAYIPLRTLMCTKILREFYNSIQSNDKQNKLNVLRQACTILKANIYTKQSTWIWAVNDYAIYTLHMLYMVFDIQ